MLKLPLLVTPGKPRSPALEFLSKHLDFVARGVMSPVVSLFPAIGDVVPGTFHCFRGTPQGITRLVVFGASAEDRKGSC